MKPCFSLTYMCLFGFYTETLFFYGSEWPLCCSISTKQAVSISVTDNAPVIFFKQGIVEK